MGAVIKLRDEQFRKIAISKGWVDADSGRIVATRVAKAIKCEVSTVTRILGGTRSPGGEFIARLLQAVEPWDFNDLFEVGNTDEQVPA